MIEPSAFSVRVAESPSEVVLVLQGELDMATADELKSCLAALEPSDRKMVVDLRRLTFMDSSGIGAIVNAHRWAEAYGTELVVRHCSKPVRRVLALTGADAVVSVEG